MCNLRVLLLVFCCVVFAVTTGRPSDNQDVVSYQGSVVPVRVIREASPKPYNPYYRPGFGGSGFGGSGFNRPGFGGSGFNRPGFGGSGFNRPGFGGSGYWRPGSGVSPGGSFSNSNANSFSQQFQTPFGSFSLSSSNSFGGSANYGKK